jgi:hypothetical protein
MRSATGEARLLCPLRRVALLPGVGTQAGLDRFEGDHGPVQRQARPPAAWAVNRLLGLGECLPRADQGVHRHGVVTDVVQDLQRHLDVLQALPGAAAVNHGLRSGPRSNGRSLSKPRGVDPGRVGR